MKGKQISKVLIVGFLIVVMGLLVVLPAVANHDMGEISAVDAKLGQYIVDDFDYAAAADNNAARWEAMAAYYDMGEMSAVDTKLGQYIVDDFDYVAAADNNAARWEAMAAFYADNGLLNQVASIN